MELDDRVTAIEEIIGDSWHVLPGCQNAGDDGVKEAERLLEEQLQSLAKSLDPSKDHEAARMELIKRFQQLVDEHFPAPSQLTVVPFGSFRSSCYSPHSDMELALSGSVDAFLLQKIGAPAQPQGKTKSLSDNFPNRLPDIHKAFRTSLDRIKNLSSAQDVSYALVTLFGEEAVHDAGVSEELAAEIPVDSLARSILARAVGPRVSPAAPQDGGNGGRQGRNDEPRRSDEVEYSDRRQGRNDEPRRSDEVEYSDSEYSDDLYNVSLGADEYLMELYRYIALDDLYTGRDRDDDL